MTSESIRQLSELLPALTAGELGGDSLAELNSLARGNADAQAAIVDELELHALLTLEFAADCPAPLPHQDRAVNVRTWLLRSVALSVVATVCLIITLPLLLQDRAPRGSAELVGGWTVSASAESRYVVEASDLIVVDFGRLRVEKTDGPGRPMRLKSPHGILTCDEGIFVLVVGGRETTVEVIRGSAVLENGIGAIRGTTGDQLQVGDGGAPQRP